MKNSGTMLNIHSVTMAFMIATARNTCGMDQPSFCCTSRLPIAAATMKTAFCTLVAAITRESSSRGVRLCTSANSGTTKKPANMPIMVRSNMMRRLPGWAMKPPTSSPPTGARPLRAK